MGEIVENTFGNSSYSETNKENIPAPPRPKTPTDDQTARNQLQQLENTLAEIKNDEAIRTEIDISKLPILKEDQYGYSINLEPGVAEQIAGAQKPFEELFINSLQKYHKIGELEDIDPENPFCFSPQTLLIIEEKILKPTGEAFFTLLSENPQLGENKEKEWQPSNIKGILGKLLAFESFKLSREMANRTRIHIENFLTDEREIKITELCTGAGINTGLLYETLKETGKRINIDTCDYSLQSIACSAALLSSMGIPLRVKLDEGTNNPDDSFEGVTIHYEKAEEFIKRDSSRGSHLIISDSGINYFEPENHRRVLEEAMKQLHPKGLIQICTLDSKTSVELSVPKMLGIISLGKPINNFLRAKKKGEVYKQKTVMEQGKEKHIITEFLSPETALQYDLLKYLLYHDTKMFGEYLSGAKAAAGITKTLSPLIKTPIEYTQKVLSELSKGKGNSNSPQLIPSLEEQKVYLTRICELSNAPIHNREP